MDPYINEYRSPSPEQLVLLEQAEDLYINLEAFIRNHLKAGMLRQQALFRLRESQIWTKEGLKLGETQLDEPTPTPTDL